MTVCIASLCAEKMDDGGRRRVILCTTDTKLSSGFTSASLGRKWNPLPGTWLTMLSANDLSHAESFIEEIRTHLQPPATNSLAAVTTVLSDARHAVIDRLAADTMPPGLTLDQFWTYGKDRLPEATYTRIYDGLNGFRLETDLLVVGFDGDGRSHIVEVGEIPPAMRDRGVFAVIGSGYELATGILSAYNPTPTTDWRHAAYQVYAAKSAAERAEGVDDVTFMMRATQEGIDYLAPSKLEPFLKEYGLLPPKKRWDELKERLEKEVDLTTHPEKGEKAHFGWDEVY